MTEHGKHTYGLSIYGRNSHFRKIQLNEMLVGQDWDYIAKRFEQENETISLDFSNYYLCVSGLRKDVYTGVYGLKANDYMRLFLMIEEKICAFMEALRCHYELTLYYYGKKQIVLLFSPSEGNAFDPMCVADYLEQTLQNIYEAEIFHGDTRYCNITALSSRLNNYGQLAENFSELCALHRLSFFVMEPVVMTRQKAEKLLNHCTYEEIFETLKQVRDDVGFGSREQIERNLSDLFMKDLRFQLSFSLCQDVLSELKKQFHRYHAIYEMDYEIPPDSFWLIDTYANIKEMSDAVTAQVLCLTQKLREGSKPLSYLSQEAVRFLRTHFREEISLMDMAKYVNASPTYLSRVFNREVGMGFPEYVTALRITEAKRLLAQGRLRICEIAQTVGLSDANHFGRLFKKAEGITPQQYRQQFQKPL